MKEVRSLEEWTACLAASDEGPVLLFKHSTRCPISAAAYQRMTKFLADPPAGCPECYLVAVIESRPVSNAVAENLAVQHQSPQIILIKNRQALWSASHHGINADNIVAALGKFLVEAH